VDGHSPDLSDPNRTYVGASNREGLRPQRHFNAAPLDVVLDIDLIAAPLHRRQVFVNRVEQQLLGFRPGGIGW